MKIDTVKGLRNLHDLGGTALSDGRIIRRGLILRSDSLDRIPQESITKITQELKVATVIDLRTPLEVEEHPDVAIAGVEYVHIPIFTENVIGITREHGSDIGKAIRKVWSHKKIHAMLPDMDAIYANVMRDRAIVEKISRVIHIVIENALAGRTTLFHCSQGKDRTGAVSALLLELLGANRETIVDNYVSGGRVYRGKALKDAILMVLVKTDPRGARIAYRSNLAKREFIEQSFRSIEECYGSLQQFFRNTLGITDECRSNFIKAVTA